MIAHVLLNLLNSLRKRDKASLAFYLFSPTRLINSIRDVRFYLSYEYLFEILFLL